ncbi:MAG TPA: hypothetical protein VFU15_03105 [Bacteroidia bacterium]|nr:hypothetical protein [Bacteroidia bacterium]
MKNVIGVFAASLLLILSSCGGKPANPLVGKWKFEKMEMAKTDMTSNMRKSMDTMMKDSGMADAMDTMAKSMNEMGNAMGDLGAGLASAFMTGSTYEFENDGTLEISVLFTTSKGKYTLSSDNKSLTMTSDGKDQQFTVTKCDDQNLDLTTADNMVWHFTKDK